MKYEGPLYGKLAGRCFNTGKTSADWDAIESAAKRRLDIIRLIIGTTDVQNMLPDAVNDAIDAELSQST